jgi:hypothetical protein
MPTAAISRYWDSLPDECICGAPSQCIHHIIHVNGQRISKNDWLVVKLCHACHQGKGGVHDKGGDRAFYEATGWNLVEIAVLNRQNHEARAR